MSLESIACWLMFLSTVLSFKCIFFYFKHSDCVLGSECCQCSGDLHSLLCLNASSVDTDGGLKLLLC